MKKNHTNLATVYKMLKPRKIKNSEAQKERKEWRRREREGRKKERKKERE